jgi:hypothetical protein
MFSASAEPASDLNLDRFDIYSSSILIDYSC